MRRRTGGRGGGYRTKNKNPTRQCGEKTSGTPSQCICMFLFATRDQHSWAPQPCDHHDEFVIFSKRWTSAPAVALKILGKLLLRV